MDPIAYDAGYQWMMFVVNLVQFFFWLASPFFFVKMILNFILKINRAARGETLKEMHEDSSSLAERPKRWREQKNERH